MQTEVTKASKEIVLSDFLSKVRNNQVEQVKIKETKIYGTLSKNAGGEQFKTYCGAYYLQTIKELIDNNVEVEIVSNDPYYRIFNLVQAILSIASFAIIALFGFSLVKQMQNAGGRALGFTKSKAKLQPNKKTKITFEDVAGIEEAKDELKEIVSFLKDPMKFHKLGGQIPRGCLLIGAPGTGKTLLAKAISGEANVPFFSISGSDFVEMFVGIGASRVRDMFEQGKKNSPCIIFIDEIDAVGRNRGSGMGAGHEEREQTLNQLLVEMDGFNPNEGIIVIAATNRPDVLDHALLRPGRFDRQVHIPHPDIKGREEILKLHLKKVKYDPKLDINVIARGTPGFSGAELRNLVNESALLAANKGKKYVEMSDIESSKDKVLMGIEKKSLIISDERKKLTAYHEGGHALVSLYVQDSDPIHKITIMPRGKALGMLVRLPKDDNIMLNKQKIESDIRVAMGGRAAEEIIFGQNKITSGASSDIQMATKYARAMVTEWGMSEKLGMVSHKQEQPTFYHTNDATSEHTSSIIDQEVKSIIDKAYNDAKTILKKHIDKLHLIAETLIKKETLTGEEVKDLLNNKPKKKITKKTNTKTE